MLWNRVLGIDIGLATLLSNDIPFSILRWTDTNEDIVFFEKNSRIYYSFYSITNETFSAPTMLITGLDPSPIRDNDYIVLKYIFNEKSQELSVLYTDLVQGIVQFPLDLWDGLLPFDVTSFEKKTTQIVYKPTGELTHSVSDSVGGALGFYDRSEHLYGIAQRPQNFAIEGIELHWSAVPVYALYNHGTTYRVYEEGVFIGETSDTHFTYNITHSTEYSVEAVYTETYQPHAEAVTGQSFKNSGTQFAGVENLESIDITALYIPETIDYHGFRPIYTPFVDDSSLYAISTPSKIINNKNTHTLQDFGLDSVDTRIEIIPLYTELLSNEVEKISLMASAISNIRVDIDKTPFEYTDYYGNFIT
jgi:hypothetical protein